MTGGGLALALAAAAAFSGCSLLQHAGAARAESERRLLLTLMRDRLWLLGSALDGVAIALQATALRFAPLAVVQPVLVSGLVMVVLLEAAAQRRLPRADSLAGAFACSAGLAIFLGVTPPASGIDHPSAALGVVLAAVAAAALVAGAVTPRRSRWRSLLLAGLAGVEYAVSAAALQLTVRHVEHPVALLEWWPPYVLVGSGLAGVLLNQRAFHAGPLFGALALMSVTEPVVSVVIGVLGLRQSLPQSPLDNLAVAAAGAVMVTGIVMLSRQQRGDAATPPRPLPPA